MRRRLKPRIAGGLALAIVAGLILTTLAAPALASHSTAPPWESPTADPLKLGELVLYDSAGNVLTGGSDLNHLADFAAASSGPSAGANLATLFFANPDKDLPTGSWATTAASPSTAFPNNAAPHPVDGNGTPPFTRPLVTLGATDANFAAWVGGISPDPFPGHSNVYQVRLKDSGAFGAGSGANYWSTNIIITGTTWSIYYPDLAATTTTISTTPPNGGNTTTGNNVTMTATVAPASAANGTVQFFDGATPVGSPQAVTTAAPTTAVVTDTAPPDGVHNYTAKFTPNAATLVDDSTSAVSSVSVGPPPVATTTALAANPTTASQGAPVTLTATVSATSGSPTGSVTFFSGPGGASSPPHPTTLGTDSTPGGVGNNEYEIIVSTLPVGTHDVIATFTPTGSFSPSTSPEVLVTITAAASCSQPGSSCTDDQDIEVTVSAGSLTISTPYTPTNRFNLGTMTLNPAGTLLSATATFPAIADQPIRVVSTLAGNPTWTASVSATALNTAPANATPIDAEGLGLTTLIDVAHPAGKAAPTFTDNPADDPSIASDDANLGLEAPAHVFATSPANDGNGTWDMRGTLTLLAPSSTLAGTYFGVITFTVV